MKRLFSIVAILAATMLTFSACEDGMTGTNGGDNNTNNPSNPNNPGGNENEQDPINPGEDVIGDSDLTPGEHKARLEEIAIEFVEAFEPTDVEELVNSAFALAEYAEYFDYGFGVESEDVVEEGGAPVETLARGLQRFSAADIVAFATRATEDFVVDINDPDMNPYAGKCYTWNGDDYAWEETNGKDKTITFEWDDTVATISWAKSTKVEYYYEDEDMNVVVYVPNNVEISFKINGKEYLNIVLETNITNIQTWAPEYKVTLNGGYEFTGRSKGNSKGLEAGGSIKKSGKTLLNAAAVVAINDATDIDNWMTEYYDEYDGVYYTEVSGEYFLDQVKTGAAQLDILELSIVGEGDFKGMYEEIERLEEEYDYWDENWNKLPDVEKEYCDEVCKYVNEKVEIVLLYNDTNERVANIVFSTIMYNDEYDGYIDYDIEPILVFPDGSKFAFEEYFTEKAFGDLIEVVQALAEEIDSLVY